MIPTLLALAMSPAPVYVESAPGPEPGHSRSLRDQLMIRLLEEGYPLAPSEEHATRTLRVETTPDGLRVEAHGEDAFSFEVATGPVLRLEAVHRAIEALEEVTPREPTVQVQTPRHAVHVDTEEATVSPDELQRTLVSGLLAQGSTVVPLDAEPDAVLCAEGEGPLVSLSRADDVDRCGADPLLVALEGPTGLDEEIDEVMTEPVAPRRATIDTTPVAPSRVPTGLSADRVTEAPRKGPAVRIGARTGVYGRITQADAAVATSLRVGREPGPGGLLDVMFVPTSVPDISIFETNVSAGFGWMWELTPTVGMHVQGLGGLLIHRYRQQGAATGHRYDWTAEVPVGTSIRLARGLRLDLAVRGGVSGRPREHRVDDVVVWQRSAWKIGGSVGLSYGWRSR